MDKLFGQADVVEAGEEEALDRKVAELGTGDGKNDVTLELTENVVKQQQSV